MEAIDPGTHVPSHDEWEASILDRGYRFVAFDGINRWYVADEHADQLVGPSAGAPQGTTIAGAIATPFHALDIGVFGWRTAAEEALRLKEQRSTTRQAWQREIVMNEATSQVRSSEYERRIIELDAALSQVQSSRTFALSRTFARVGKKGVHTLRRMRTVLPAPVNNQIVRSRHLKHVTTNMGHLTDPSYLGATPEQPVTWVATGENDQNNPIARPPIPPGLSWDPLTEKQIEEVRAWLREHPFDRDDQLDARMDNLDDEVGRTQAALRTRLRLAEGAAQQQTAHGSRVAFDARALQSPAFGTRGIGRFAAAALAGLRSAVGDEHITLIIDPGAHRLPQELAGTCHQTPRVVPDEAPLFGVLIEPSPMTHSPDPIAALLLSDIYSLAVVFDFIPRHYPNVYLSGVAQRAEYAACLDALTRYQDFLCISHLVSEELQSIIRESNRHQPASPHEVAWPRDIADMRSSATTEIDSSGPIVLMTGDEPRKNTFGGLAGIAAATSDEGQRNVVVIGMAGQDDRVHHWSIAAAMRPGEARTLGRVSDEELHRVLHSASLVVVPSFDEGLSLPVIEAARAGVPVVASDIPAHRELIGAGSYLFDPTKPTSIAMAVRKARGSNRITGTQVRALAAHRHAVLEDAVADR
ncbi:MAG TPA: glycosyltransferase, partial [Acidimicrobiia bacterium]